MRPQARRESYLGQIARLAISGAALLTLIGVAVAAPSNLLRLALVLPIIGSAFFVALRIWLLAATRRGGDIANPS